MDMNVFNEDAFSMIELTMAIDRMGYVPGTFGGIPGLVTPAPVRTEEIWIENRGFQAAVIQTSPRGAPPTQVGGDKRKARPFKTLRLAQGSRITPSELQGIREFGMSDLKSLQMELGRRMFKMKQNNALTKERWLLAMIQGTVIDADNTVLYNWANEFGQTVPAEVAFNFGSASLGAIRQNCNLISRTILRNLQGLGGGGVRVLAACGDEFWDELTTSPEVRQTYLNWTAAAELRSSVGAVWSAFSYGDIGFFNYRGTDDNSTVAIPVDKAKFFPINAGIFQWALSPAEQFAFINTLGKDMYAWIVRDQQRDMWADLETATYPLPVCVQPSALMSGRAGS